MARIGTVSLFWKRIDIHAFNGDVVDVTHSKTVLKGATIPAARVTVRNPLSHETCEIDVVDLSADFHVSHKVSVLWGETPRQNPAFLSVHNHSSGQVQPLRAGNNELAGLPFSDLGLVGAAIAVACGVATGAGLLSWALVAAGAGYIAFTWLCQKRLIDSSRDIMRTYTPDFGVVPKPATVSAGVIPEVIPEIEPEVVTAVPVSRAATPVRQDHVVS